MTSKFIELPLPDFLEEAKRDGAVESDLRIYVYLANTVMVGSSDAGWHMSISREGHLPTWEDVRDARYELCPKDITMAMLLPPEDEYVNVHKFAFHLWQVPGETGK